ncbi:MAG TPA: alpha/beta hydrolase [Burkholderiaceae bacterium]|nr:alpha/beta hydrolase [Burkholderiaceae bacterium]
MADSPVAGIVLKTVTANGITQRYAECGSGPLVLFCHGWPESWYSWRHQMLAASAAGYRCVAPDMRGYGGTDSPADVEHFTVLDMVGDMVALVKELGATEAVVVGHDWGAPIAWHCALLRPDLFRAVVGMSVPWAPRGGIDLLSALHKMGITRFYMQYFQTPGVAEAEFEQDVRTSLRRIYYTASGDMDQKGKGFAVLPEGGGFLTNTVDPVSLPSWLSEADLDWFAGEFSRAGFRGGLNWYRNLTRNWRLMAPWHGRTINQPSMFIAGSRDGVLRFPASMQQIEAFPRTLPGIRGCHIIDGPGHWVQQENPVEVNRLLLEFLAGL